MTSNERESLLVRKRDLESEIERARAELAHLEADVYADRIKELEGVLEEIRQQVIDTRGKVASGFSMWRALPLLAIGAVLMLVFARGCR